MTEAFPADRQAMEIEKILEPTTVQISVFQWFSECSMLKWTWSF